MDLFRTGKLVAYGSLNLPSYLSQLSGRDGT